MKKVLSVVLAVAMVLGCVASLAFVLDNQAGITTPTNSALQVEGIHVTDEAAMTTGVKVYSELANTNDALYARNTIIRFAIDLAVKNPSYDLSVESVEAGKATLILESDTVDFRLNQQQPYTSMVLYKPYYVDGIVSTNLVQAVANTAGYKPYVSPDAGRMEVLVTYYTEFGGKTLDAAFVSDNTSGSQFDPTPLDRGVILTGISDNPWTVKTDHTLVVTGVTKGDTTQEGRVTLSMEDKAGDSFDDETPGVVKVEKNGHTYIIEKWYASNAPYKTSGTTYTDPDSELKDSYTMGKNGQTELKWVDRMTLHDKYSTNSKIYDVDAVGYQVFVLLDGENTATESDDIYGLVGMFETEQVRKGELYDTATVKQRGEDVEHLGISLGLTYYTGNGYEGVYTNLVPFAGPEYTLAGTTTKVYKATDPDYLYAFKYNATYSNRSLYSGEGVSTDTSSDNDGRYVAGLTARQALEQFMSDFGFSTGAGYNYKVQDVNFVNAATYDELGTATYNGNAIVVPQPEEDDDVEEPTDNDEVPDEGDIDEEPIPDEPIPDETPEPVPETGDASAAVAVALTAAALVAAAGLAVVLKKAR